MEQARVEYFRGKDFVSFIKNHPECKEILEEDKDLDTEDIANVLLEKNLLVRCDRVTKTLRPGKKKLSTWPVHLEIFRVSLFAVDWMIDLSLKMMRFFPWTFEKRHPLWQTLSSFFWPVLTRSICLFPVYPHRCKLIVLYSCAGILLMILSLLFVRAVAFGGMWILLGKRVWFFPNILAEEATLKELFRFWPKKDEEEPPKWRSRLFYTVVAVVVVMLLRRHAPDEAARARMSNIIDDVLEWSPKLALSGLMENQPPVKITMCSYLCRKHAWSLNNVQNVLGIDCYASKRLNTLVEPYSSYASKNKDKSINAPDWGEVVTCGSLLPLQAGTILVF
ncbi:unnamed protein product [Brassica oleracea var. botrytis]